MCLSKSHVEYLEKTNEIDFQQGKISYETYVRFTDIVDRCRDCDLCGNGEYGDILGECRLHFLRVFVSMKRDTERLMADRRAQAQAGANEAAAPSAAAAAPDPPATAEPVADPKPLAADEQKKTA